MSKAFVVSLFLIAASVAPGAPAQAVEAARLDGKNFPGEQNLSDFLGLHTFVGSRLDWLGGRVLTNEDVLTLGRVIGLVETRALLRDGQVDPSVVRVFGGAARLRATILSILPPSAPQTPAGPFSAPVGASR